MLVDYWKAGRTDGKTIRSTSYNFYGTNAVRASAADIEDALVRTDTYKGDHEKTASTILQSKTFFFTGFGKGEIGRASCRERGKISVVAGSLKKKYYGPKAVRR